jgi:hypothetical protein
MTQIDSDAAVLAVTLVGRDGKPHYDSQSKRRLIEACLQPGVSVARLALHLPLPHFDKLPRYLYAYNQPSTLHVPRRQSVPAPLATRPNRVSESHFHHPNESRAQHVVSHLTYGFSTHEENGANTAPHGRNATGTAINQIYALLLHPLA